MEAVQLPYAKATSRRQITKFPDILGTWIVNLERMKGCVNLGATQWF